MRSLRKERHAVRPGYFNLSSSADLNARRTESDHRAARVLVGGWT